MSKAEFAKDSILVCFFRGQAPITISHNIEIKDMRFSYMENKWEAKEILDMSTGVVFKADEGMILYELGWKNISVKGIAQSTTVMGSKRTMLEILITD